MLGLQRIEKWKLFIPLWFIVLYTGYKRYVWAVNYNQDWQEIDREYE